jgi:predicted CXXCH cytochrome family protein
MTPRYKKLVPFILIAVLYVVTATFAQENDLKYRLKPGASGKVCLKCHVNLQETMKKPFVHTPLKTGDCTGCHNPHTSSHGKLLAANTTSICSICHKSVVPADARSKHKVVAEGGCMKCHDPHAASNKFNLLKGGNDLCFSCHKEMGEAVTKAKFKHSPVGKGCLTCHDPHASAKFGFLLKNDVPALCVGCHKTDKPLFAKQHMNYPVAKARCTTCHDPHGSDVAGILYNNVHRPVAGKMCNQCHEDAASSTPLKTKRDGMDLCKGCHNEMVNRTLGKNRLHWPLLEKRGCMTCHNPHASKQKGLLKGDMLTICGSCHKDTIQRQEKSMTKHAPIMEGKCTACHDPHASDSLFLANKPSTIDMCGKCHDWQKHSTHPIGENVKDPRNKNLTLQCLSCHRSHGTEFKHFIPFATTSELCTQCHEQYKR